MFLKGFCGLLYPFSPTKFTTMQIFILFWTRVHGINFFPNKNHRIFPALWCHLEGQNTAHFPRYHRYSPGPGGGGQWLQSTGALVYQICCICGGFFSYRKNKKVTNEMKFDSIQLQTTIKIMNQNLYLILTKHPKMN